MGIPQLRPVIDGSGAPDKPGRKEWRKTNDDVILERALDGLGVSYLQAPGEAEAECCRLQTLQLVDAETAISNQHIGKTKRDSRLVRVVRGEKLKIGESQLKPEGCVLFAMLVGGDYDPRGLRGCGTANALKLVKAGLGRSLCSLQNPTECNVGRENVVKKFIAKLSINLVVPGDFPNCDTLQRHKSPVVQSDADLRNHARLHLNYDPPPRGEALLRHACRHFNFWSKQYYNHIAPILLSRFLAERQSSLPRQVVHEIKLTRIGTKKTEDEQEHVIPVRKLTFSPTGVTILKNHADFKRLESTRAWKTDTKYYGERRVKCEIPTFLLRNVLPLDVLDPPANEAKTRAPKRKRQSNPEETASPAPAAKKSGRPRKLTSTSAQIPEQAPSHGDDFLHVKTSTIIVSQAPVKPKPQRPHPSALSHAVELSDSDEELDLLCLKPRVPKSSAGAVLSSTAHGATFLPDLQDLEERQLQEALRNSLEDLDATIRTSSRPTSVSRTNTISKASPLAPLRTGPNATKPSMRTPASVKGSMRAMTDATPMRVPDNSDCIDLTEDCGSKTAQLHWLQEMHVVQGERESVTYS